MRRIDATGNRLHLSIGNNLGLIYAIGAAVLFSFKPVLVKLIYVYDLDAVTLLAWRMLVSLPVYLAVGIILWLKRSHRPSKVVDRKTGYIKATIIGLLGYYLAAVLDLQGLKTITAQLERLILFSYPTWVAILSWIILKKSLGRRAIVSLLLSYIGIAVIVISDWQQLGPDTLVGSIWVLLAAIVFALYVVLSKPVIDEIGAKEFTVVAMVSSSLIALAHFFLIHPWQTLQIPLDAFWLVFAMAILTTVFPTFLLAGAIALLGPAKTAVTGTIGPVMTSLFAAILLNEQFGWPQAIGLVLVVLAVSILQSKPRPNI